MTGVRIDFKSFMIQLLLVNKNAPGSDLLHVPNVFAMLTNF